MTVILRQLGRKNENLTGDETIFDFINTYTSRLKRKRFGKLFYVLSMPLLEDPGNHSKK